jgi:putative ABC transport system ATP-binding protein
MSEASVSILEAKAVRKQYQLGQVTVEVLDSIDFAVNKGEFVAIMGPSGSGKSTLLQLLGGLDKPSDGEITLAEQKLKMLSDDEITLVRRRNVGFIFQFYNLVPTLSAEENISLPLIIDGKDIKEYGDRIEELLRVVGMTERRDHRPDQLSGGQQQRVAIARAMVTNPVVLLADEPTGNLDSARGVEIMNLLTEINRDKGVTVIMVTHESDMAAYAKRTVHFRDGMIETDRSHPGGV